MSFDWAEYLNLAEALVREKARFTSEEACFRAAISRSYYSAFCAARNLARDREGLAIRGTGEDHRLVIQHYLNSHDRRRRKIGNWLDRLRNNRNQADYVDSLSGAEPLTQASLAQAHNVLNALRIL